MALKMCVRRFSTKKIASRGFSATAQLLVEDYNPTIVIEKNQDNNCSCVKRFIEPVARFCGAARFR